MILSHTPLKMFDWLHNKHVLVSGQGSAKEILEEYPFTIYLGHVAEVSVSWKINNGVHLSNLSNMFSWVDCRPMLHIRTDRQKKN